MVQYWEPGTQYNYGDVVLYQGHRYKIIQPHRSQSDWTPDVTPALWGKLSDEDHGYEQQHQQQQHQPPSNPPYPGAPQYGGSDQLSSYPDKPSNDDGSDGRDEKKHWWEDEANKKKLEIGGGIAAGAAILGAGALAYKHHKQKQEEQRFQPPSNPPYPGAPQYGYGSNQGSFSDDNRDDKKHWWNDEANKKKLEIGGGIAAGAAILGAGALAYKHHKEKQEEQFQPPSDPPYPGAPRYGSQTSSYPEKPSDDDGSDNREENKHWWDDEANKKKLEIGGGIAAGAAILGAGALAYKHHKQKQEERKSREWVKSTWVAEAQVRTEEFRRDGPRGPVTWILTHDKEFPRDALVVGGESSPMYACRAFVDGGIQLGKASADFQKGALIGYGNKEIDFDEYEILLGDMKGLRWVSSHGTINIATLGAQPVEGGHENDGTPLYIVRAHYKETVHPGKASPKLKGAYIPWGGTEQVVQDYQVLCYA